MLPDVASTGHRHLGTLHKDGSQDSMVAERADTGAGRLGLRRRRER